MEDQAETEQICLCSLKTIAQFLGKKWFLPVLNCLGNHNKIRFNEIIRELKLNPRMLSEILKDLESLDMVVRESSVEIPPKVEYSLTIKGRQFRKALMPLTDWASVYSGSYTSCCIGTRDKGLINIHKI